MAIGESPTAKRRRLGLLLRKFRTEAKISAEVVSQHMDRNDAWVSRVERGRTGLRRLDLERLLDLYGVDASVQAELADLAKAGRERGWWSNYSGVLSRQYSSYIGFEAEASRLLTYDSLVVTGLLQTEAYARKVLQVGAPEEDPAVIERKVEVRLNRQRRLNAEDPLRLWLIFDEAVLHRVFGGDLRVHVGQLDHLVKMAEMYNVRLQVMPFREAGNPGMLSSFTVMEFPNDPTMAYIEGLTGDLYEDAPESERYRVVFDNLRASALGEPSSIALIKEVAADLRRDL
jgi:hypothetical protein